MPSRVELITAAVTAKAELRKKLRRLAEITIRMTINNDCRFCHQRHRSRNADVLPFGPVGEGAEAAETSGSNSKVLRAAIVRCALPRKAPLVFFAHLVKLRDQNEMTISNSIMTHHGLAAFGWV